MTVKEAILTREKNNIIQVVEAFRKFDYTFIETCVIINHVLKENNKQEIALADFNEILREVDEQVGG